MKMLPGSMPFIVGLSTGENCERQEFQSKVSVSKSTV